MSKLNDKQKKLLIAEHIDGVSYGKLAKKYGICETSARNICERDKNFHKLVEKKQAENTQAVLSFMDERKNDACSIIEKTLTVLNDSEKLEKASVNNLAVMMGIIIDKFSANEAKTNTPGVEDLTPLAELLGDKNDSK